MWLINITAEYVTDNGHIKMKTEKKQRRIVLHLWPEKFKICYFLPLRVQFIFSSYCFCDINALRKTYSLIV